MSMSAPVRSASEKMMLLDDMSWPSGMYDDDALAPTDPG
jgi:hypothetical protein